MEFPDLESKSEERLEEYFLRASGQTHLLIQGLLGDAREVQITETYKGKSEDVRLKRAVQLLRGRNEPSFCLSCFLR